MNRAPGPTRLALCAALLMAAALPGCFLLRLFHSEPKKVVTKRTMKSADAWRALVRARARLYDDRSPDYNGAVALVDDVIARCDESRYVWEGYAVKAVAARRRAEQEQTPAADEAAEQAREQVDLFLLAELGCVDPSRQEELRVLLKNWAQQGLLMPGADSLTLPSPDDLSEADVSRLGSVLLAYAKHAAPVKRRQEPAKRLEMWSGLVRGWYQQAKEPQPDVLTALDAAFRGAQNAIQQHKTGQELARDVAKAGLDDLLWRTLRDAQRKGAKPGPLLGFELTALKRLLVIYVEGAAATGQSPQARAYLAELQARILSRYAASPEHAKPIHSVFATLAQMLDENADDTEAFAAVRRLVHQYVARFNSRDPKGLRALLLAGSPLAKRIGERGLLAVSGRQVNALYLAGALTVQLQDSRRAGEPPLTASATCDLLATSPAGWSTLNKGAQFLLIHSRGRWYIQDIKGHP